MYGWFHSQRNMWECVLTDVAKLYHMYHKTSYKQPLSFLVPRCQQFNADLSHRWFSLKPTNHVVLNLIELNLIQ